MKYVLGAGFVLIALGCLQLAERCMDGWLRRRREDEIRRQSDEAFEHWTKECDERHRLEEYDRWEEAGVRRAELWIKEEYKQLLAKREARDAVDGGTSSHLPVGDDDDG